MAILQSRRRLSKPRTDAVGGMLGVGLLGGAANVIMQLARPGVGYGVVESRVESGRIDRHPIKRARTTFTYLAVAAQGTPEQQAAYRRAVNGAHAQVYSTDESPVSYNAFDPDLQMWVGACMYKGVVDVYKLFVGEIDDERRRAPVVRRGHSARHDAAGASREVASRSGRVRSLLGGVGGEGAHRRRGARLPLAHRGGPGARGETPVSVQRRLDDFNLVITGGFLPQRFRDEMRLDWDDDKQRRFDRLIKRFGR